MQLINFDQQHISTSDLANEQWKQTFALEKAQDEIVLLREQINSLQQYLSEQLGHQQAVEQELHCVNQELHCANQEVELMNVEIMQFVEVNQLFFEAIKEFTSTLPADGEMIREELIRRCFKGV